MLTKSNWPILFFVTLALSSVVWWTLFFHRFSSFLIHYLWIFFFYKSRNSLRHTALLCFAAYKHQLSNLLSRLQTKIVHQCWFLIPWIPKQHVIPQRNLAELGWMLRRINHKSLKNFFQFWANEYGRFARNVLRAMSF